MKTTEIRIRFLNFFKAKGHKIVPSDSLIPQNDPTVLFTGAGMNQFKEYFLGIRKDLKRACSSQKCLRTGDLDQVGKTPYHHSFFEMLGNFSFGDYFKEEAIGWAWEFLTKEMRLDPKRIFVSVHQNDEEAFRIWEKKIGIPAPLIAKLGDKSNFWPANAPKDGPNGPCGTCSEIFYDRGKEFYPSKTKFWADDESGRFAEIWNLVFTQFDRREGGVLKPLVSKNIDTGMGLERLACVMQGKKSNFEIDLFEPIFRQMIEKLKGSEKDLTPALCAVADHVRAVAVAVADGALPANEGRGYVIRKLIRRAVWHGRGAGFETPFMGPLVPVVIATLEDAYPELAHAQKSVQSVVESEEARFEETLDRGLQVLSGMLKEAKAGKKKLLSGEDVFQLYDTYGFPDELTQSIAQKEKIKIDRGGFLKLLEEQRRRAKESSKMSDSIFASPSSEKELMELPETKFLGYSSLEAEAKVLWVGQSGSETALVLDQTPFYPEGGGQVGDIGVLEGAHFKFQVTDTRKKERVILHYGKYESGQAKTGIAYRTKVNPEARAATRRNHTGTHLLHAALRTLLGTHVRQMGSLVSPDRLRFDFTYGKALAKEEIKKIEDWVNAAILENQPVQTKEQSYEEATRGGAIAFFGEKYGAQVRTVEVPGRSKELCGGTHCRQTGDIGAFVIVSESSVGSGVRRIEAMTGLNAIRYLKDLEEKGNQISELLKTPFGEAPGKIEKLLKRIKELEKSGPPAPKQELNVDELIESGKKIGSVKLIAKTVSGANLSSLRTLADQIRAKTKQSVLALFGTEDMKVHTVIALTEDLAESGLDARKIAEKISPFLEGSAGGRKTWAQGGGRNAGGINKVLEALPGIIQKS